jgi:glucose/arabinose dehydrogenase
MHRLFRQLGFVLGLSALAGLGVPTPVAAAGLNEELVADGLSAPVFLTHAGDERLFVVEQDGDIEIVERGTFLDLSEKVEFGGERGLLGLAFHPDYGTNRRFYVSYVSAGEGDLVVAEYRTSLGDSDVADPTTERIVLTVEHSAGSIHFGGWLGFKGQNLHISTGDAGDNTNAPDIGSMLGKILRINPLDPDGPDGPRRYSVPGKNPYVGRRGLDEIFSRGLRNPWRCSFDRVRGSLWCGDVGEASYEEVDRVKTGRGINFGWPKLEGPSYYPPDHACTQRCRTLPITQYTHYWNQTTTGAPCTSVTGGYVSRRPGATLYGSYVFGDFCSGLAWTIPANFARGDALPVPVATGHSISSFGEDLAGRLYLVDRAAGSIFRLSDS